MGIAQRGYMPEFRYQDILVSAGTVQSQNDLPTLVTAAVGGSIALGPDGCRGFTMHYLWNQDAADGQTLAATLLIEASNDERAFINHDDYASADWFDITSQITRTDPTSGAGDYLIQVSDVMFSYIRLSLTSITGSGRFVNKFAAHGQ